MIHHFTVSTISLDSNLYAVTELVELKVDLKTNSFSSPFCFLNDEKNDSKHHKYIEQSYLFK